MNPATRTSRRGPARAAIRSARSIVAAGTTWGATLTLATISPAATTWPSNRVNSSSGSIRSIRSTRAVRTWTTPSCAATQVDPALGGPAGDEPGPADGRRQALGGLVLVEVGRVHREDRDPGRGERARPALDPHRRPAEGREVGRRTAAGPWPSAPRRRRGRGSGPPRPASGGGGRPGTIRSSRTRRPGQSAAARAASIARRVSTTAISARYVPSAWMSDPATTPSVACAAAAAIAAASPLVPMSAASTPDAR